MCSSVVERCPDKTEVEGPIPSTRTKTDMEIENKQIKKVWWRDSILIFTKVSAWIAFPVVIALFVGKALDKHFGTEPWLFLALIGISFTLSLVGIYKTTKKEMKKMADKANDDQNNKSSGELNQNK